MSRLALVSNRSVKSTTAVVGLMRSSYRIERRFEAQSLKLREELVKKRLRTFREVTSAAEDASGKKSYLLETLIGTRLLRRLIPGLGGGRGGLGGSRGRFTGPRLPFTGPPVTRGGGGRFRLPFTGPSVTRGGGGLRGLRGLRGIRGGVGPLAVLATGFDYAGRLGEGQTQTQAIAGAGGGLAGALAGGATGAKIGAAIGTFFGPGIGTAIGAAIGGIGGSIIGAGIGGGIADFFTGANRREEKVKENILETSITSFTPALDKFDDVLDRLEGSTIPIVGAVVSDMKKEDRKRIVFPFGFNLEKPRGLWGNLLEIASNIANIISIAGIIIAIWTAAVAEPTFAGEMAAASATPGLINIISGKLRTLWFLLARGGLKLSAGQVRAPSSIIKRMQGTGRIDLTRMKGVNISPDSPLKGLKIKKSFVRGKDLNTNDIRNTGPFDWPGVDKLAPKPRADGGNVTPGRPYIVGEIGEELFVPDESGYIIPNDMLGGGQILVMNNRQGDTIIQQAPQSSGGGGTQVIPADPFDAVTKYAQMTSLMTV